MTSNKLFMALGNAKDIRVRGGSPFFLYRAGLRERFFYDAAALELKNDKLARIGWNFLRALRDREHGGYQFSTWSAERRFKQAGLNSIDAAETISQFPLFPPDSWLNDVLTNYYIDATLLQNFRDCGLGDHVGVKMQKEVLARERDRYQRATRILCMSQWAAKSIIDDYGIPSSKIHVIPPGANIDEDALPAQNVTAPPPTRTIRLGFNGKNWSRKNLVFLLMVAEALEASGYPAEVWAAGFPPSRGPSHRLLRPIGYLDKKTNMSGFVNFIKSVHFGALFSLADASPIANREFLRLGVPVLTWDVGGMRDTVPKGVGKVFAKESSPEQIASYILENFWQGGAYDELRGRVIERAHEFSWSYTMSKFMSVWEGSRAFEFNQQF